MARVFSTTQAARVLKVTPRTVARWFDQGRLKGYRIPGTRDRRIPLEMLSRFMRDNGIPVDLAALNDAMSDEV